MSYPVGTKLAITWHPRGNFLGLVVEALAETILIEDLHHSSFYPLNALCQHVVWPPLNDNDIYYPIDWMRPLENPDEEVTVDFNFKREPA